MKNHRYFIILVIFLFPSFLLHADKDPGIPLEQEWKAIIAFFPGTPEEVTEDWVFFLFDVEEHFKEDEHIYFIGIFSGNDALVPIVGPEDELIADIDISRYIGETAGYIFVMKDRDPCWCNHMPPDKVIEKAELYFYRKDG